MTLPQSLAAVIAGNGPIAAKLGQYLGNPSVHTRRPAPDGAEYPMVMISNSTGGGNEDTLRTFRPIRQHQVTVYGLKAEQMRDVETLGEMIHDLLHRRPDLLTVDNHRVVEVVCDPPQYAPGDGDDVEGRVVQVTARMTRLS